MNENKTSCAPADNQQTLWDRIDWTKAELAVRKLQARIVKAQKEGRYNKVKALQWTLTHSFYAKALAVKRVTSNGGGNTPGVDMETWEKPEAKTQAISELKRRGYQPKPLRRVHIKKSNGKLRPLGIPTMKDRAMQALYLMALEPVSETTADSRSYGFRKERRCMDAVMQCHNILRKGYSPEWILEGDIKGCFDHISHEWLLANIPMDKAILRKWLKCGYIFNKQMFPTEEGTPQGGIISPTLANMTLDGLQKVLAEKYKRVRIKGKLYSPMVNLVRYADDFIITCENRETLEKEIKPLVADFMSERGLTLSEEKTVITNIHDGFDFLGFNIRKFGNEILTKPTKKAEKRFMENIRKVTKGHKGCKQESLIRMLNAKIRGWGAYYQHGATRDSFHRIDHQIFLALWQWAKRRHSKKGKRWIKDRYWHNIRGNSWTFAAKFKKSNGKEDQLTLLKLASSFPFLQYTQIKGDMNPFDADCRLYFNKRMKSKMLVTLKGRKSLLYLWEKQGRKCPICGEPIDTHKAWNVMPTVQDGRKCNMLVHDECFKLSRKKTMETRSRMSRSLHTNRDFEKLEPYEGKPSRTVLRGEEGSNALDLPDRPSDLQQRDGRGVRAGNEIAKHFAGNNVDVIIYAVEKSLDSYKFNLLHCKQTFISQLKSGAMGARTIDEGAMDEKSGMNFSEYMALLSGNTDLLDKAKLEKRIASLEGERKSFNKGKRDSEFKLESKTRELGNNTAFIDAMTEDWNRFLSVVQTDKEGNHLNIIKVDGVDSADEKVIGKRLQEIAKNATTGGLYTQVGEFYGFPIKVVSERILKEGLEFTDNRFVVEGNYKYTYNNGHLALADPLAAARNFLNAIERIPSIIDQYKAKNEVLEREIPQLQEIAGKVWKKEEELKQLKSELAALDRKIQLELAPPTPEITEKEHEGQQVKPEAKGVRNGIRQYPEDTSPQIRNPSESIIANHTITGHPGLYAKEETRSKGLKI